MANEIASRLERLRQKSPLVHNITNFVVMNFTENALLAIGAAPVMAHALEEVEEMAALANALVLNLGTLSRPWIDAMFLAARAATARELAAQDQPGPGAFQIGLLDALSKIGRDSILSRARIAVA